MSKKRYFTLATVLILFLATVCYCGNARVDFDDREDPNAYGTSTEPGFVGKTLDDGYIEVNGIIIDFIDPEGYLDDRRRSDPNSNNEHYLEINEEQIHRDFIYAPAQKSITFRIWGLGAGQEAEIHIWAFDDMSENSPRRADWFGNGDYLFTTEFMGGIPFDWPILGSDFMDHYDFSGTATADDSGSILFTSDINMLPNPYWSIAPNEYEPFAYLNALEVYPQGTPVPVTKAHRPVPFDESEDAPINGTLSWTPGDGSFTCNVYLSRNFDDVNNSTPAALVSAGQAPNTFTPTNYLMMDKVYYWRVNVVTPVPVQGDVWSFTTANNIVVDDFEEYGDGWGIWDRWDDYITNGTSAEVYLEETSPVIGEQSMRYRFLNGTFPPYYSEASYDLTQAGVEFDTNFVGMDVKSLSIWFHGVETNPVTEQMYVTLSDGNERATVNYGDMNDILLEWWHEWNISMQEFLDDNDNLDLSNIEEITIGFAEGAPADGNVFFDDIRLYTTRCVLSERSANFAKVDYVEDCVVDYYELEIMSREWLEDFYSNPPNNPGTDGLVAYYPFDDFNDANSVDDVYLPDGVMLTKNMTPNIPHPNALWAILSPIDPCDDIEGTVEIIRPGVIIDDRPDGNCVGFDADEGEPGERIHCGRWPVIGNFEPGPGIYGGGTAFQGKGKLTLSIWIKWAGAKIRPRSQGLISKRAGWQDDEMIWMFECDSIPEPRGSFGLRQRWGDYCVYAPAGILNAFIGQWVHLAAVADITNDSNDAILYLNGAEVQRGTFYFSGGDPNAITMTIGNNSQIEEQSNENFHGELDEVSIFNRALEPDEIAYLADTSHENHVWPICIPPQSNLFQESPWSPIIINFRDFAVLANWWLVEEMWP